ncbi:MAG TPA: hypothetical protein VK989_12260, partial [Polyangia bacterium]|nr:hypothetical protein [Polyangia bacterium]
MRRFSILAGVIGLLSCALTARPARAQSLGTAGTTATTTTTTLTSADFFIGIQTTPGTNLNTFQLPRFFNQQNCNCDTPVYVYVTLEPSGFAKRAMLTQSSAGKFQIWVGTDCDTLTLQPGRCTKLLDEPLSTFLANGHETTMAQSARVFSTDTTSIGTTTDASGNVVSAATGMPTPNPTCTSATGLAFQPTVYALIDVDGDGNYDVLPAPVVSLYVDLAAPPAPANVIVRPGDEALTVTWTPDDYTTNMDLQGYQVLCQRAGGLQVFPANSFASYLETCPKTRMGTGLVSLDPLFTCSPLL